MDQCSDADGSGKSDFESVRTVSLRDRSRGRKDIVRYSENSLYSKVPGALPPKMEGLRQRERERQRGREREGRGRKREREGGRERE